MFLDYFFCGTVAPYLKFHANPGLDNQANPGSFCRDGRQSKLRSYFDFYEPSHIPDKSLGLMTLDHLFFSDVVFGVRNYSS